jgi:DNA-directed RNA polymerase III subunit RPC8
VQIAPEDFRKHSFTAIEDNINAKYANKVIQKIGLCICLWDVLWTSEGLIGHGTGLVNVNGNYTILILPSIYRHPPTSNTYVVEFRMVVFRPFKDEVIIARITSQTREGINRQSSLPVLLFCTPLELTVLLP